MSNFPGRSDGHKSGRRARTRPALWTLGVIAGCGCLLTAACSGPAPQSASARQVAGQVPAGGHNSGGAAGTGPGTGSTPAPGRSPRASGHPRPRPTSAEQLAAPQPTTPAVPACQTTWLRGIVGAPNGAAGTFYYPVQFSNVSTTTCALYGYPGVSVVASPTGPQIGPAAARIPTFAPRFVTLAPGQSAHASLQLPDPGNFGPGVCQPTTVQWLRVYPPGQTAPLYISVPPSSDPMQICTGTNLNGVIALGVFAVLSGATGP